ncbi:MAG: LysM peptidoglycan-binding domain-containing protein [Anaerolineae bacterium]|nr:LysM peptidoglycan-binding domain-containing protein [Anaerolineae bacterium]
MKKVLLGGVIGILVILLAAPVVSAGPSLSSPTVHVVRWGENLTGIARLYGTTVQAIVTANGLASSNRIYAGQRLIIPLGAVYAPPPVSGGCSYVVRPGDNLTGIAYRHGVSVNSIVRLNNIMNPNRIYAGQRLAIPCGAPAPGHPVPVHPVQPVPAPGPGGCYYVVRRGDTLARIALRFQVNMWEVVRANNIANPNVIYVGQRLYIAALCGPSPQPVPIKPGCAHITWPVQGAQLSGVLRAEGTVDVEEHGYYKLEFRGDGQDEWHYLDGGKESVLEDLLGKWNTRIVPNGRYIFRVVVVDGQGNYDPPCEMVVNVNNSP